MAKACAICGKGVSSGHNIKHKATGGWTRRAPKSKRSWRPNLRTTSIDVEGKQQKIDICTKCYKKLNK